MNAARDDLQLECTKFKAEKLEEHPKQPVPISTTSARRLPRRVSSPMSVRWREFRVQVLPGLAFGGSLALAAALWQKAVVPVPAEANANLAAATGKMMEP